MSSSRVLSWTHAYEAYAEEMGWGEELCCVMAVEVSKPIHCGKGRTCLRFSSMVLFAPLFLLFRSLFLIVHVFHICLRQVMSSGFR